jgi:hypothetical protein
VLVTTTRRLLGQRRASREAVVRSAMAAGVLRVDVDYAGPAADLDGLTVYVDDASRASLFVNGAPAPRVLANAPDHTGRPSVSLPWPRLGFPA